jgi:hypothetical protein
MAHRSIAPAVIYLVEVSIFVCRDWLRREDMKKENGFFPIVLFIDFKVVETF